MTRREILIAAIVVVAIAVLSYFVGRNQNVDIKSNKKSIVVILPSSTNPYWIDVRRGAEEARAEVPDFNIEVKVTAGDQDAKAQTFMLNDLAARTDVAAVVLGPASASEPIAALAQLARKKVPFVVVDTMLNEQKLKEFMISPAAFIGSNNRDGAEKAARAIENELKRRNAISPFRVLVLEGNRVHQSAIDRADGFYDEAKRLGMEVEGVRAEWNRAKAQDWTTEKFSGGEKPQAIFASNDDMAIGAITALKSLNLDKKSWPVIVGFDYTDVAIRAIEAGEMLGSAKQDPVKMGRMGVRFARQIAKRDPALPTIPQYLSIDIYPLTK